MSVDFATLILKADSRQLRDGNQALKEIEGQSGRTERSTTQLGKRMKKYLTFAAVAGGAALLTREILRTAQAMDETIKSARALSVGVEAFQELSYAAEMSGVSTQGLSTSLRYLNQNIYNNHKAFDALGLSVEDANGNLKSAEDMLPELADKFANMEDGAKKTALAQEMFGRSGVQMINMLKDGSAGLEEMAAEARNLGIIFDQETAQKAEMFNDNLTRLGKTKEGLFTTLTANLMPAFVNLTDEMLDASNGASIMDDVAQGLTHVIKGVMTGVVGLYFALKTAADFITTYVVGSLSAWYEAFVNIGDIMKTIGSAFIKLVRGDMSGAVEELTTGMQKNFAMTFEVVKSGADDIKKNFEDATRVIGGMFDDIDMDQQERKLSAYRDTAGSTADKIDGMADAEKRLAEAMRDAETIRQSTLNPLEQYSEAMDHLNKTFQDSSMSVETYDRALAQIENRLEESQQKHIDALYSGLLTQEEMIEQSYNRRKNMILESTEITSKQREDLLLRLTENTNEKLKGLTESYTESNLLAYEAMFGNVMDITNAFGGEQSKFYKAMFAISKSYALADSLLKLKQGLAASASVGFPQNIFTISGHLAKTAGIIGSIKSIDFAGAFDKGGHIPMGKWGIAGENGPEIIKGPANVTSTADTAKIMNRSTSNTTEHHYHYHVGTLIGNEQGYKDFIRRTEKYRISEQQRTGAL